MNSWVWSNIPAKSLFGPSRDECQVVFNAA